MTIRDILNHLGNTAVANLTAGIVSVKLPQMILPLLGVPNEPISIQTVGGFLFWILFMLMYYLCYTVLMYFFTKKTPSAIYEKTEDSRGWLVQFLFLAVPTELFLMSFNTIPWTVSLRFGRLFAMPAHFFFTLFYAGPHDRSGMLAAAQYIPMDFIAYILCHTVHLLICLSLAAWMYRKQLDRHLKSLDEKEQRYQKSQYF